MTNQEMAPLVALIQQRPNLILKSNDILGKSGFTDPKKHSGAAAVIEDGTLIGIFTERDLLKRVVAKGIDLNSITIGDIMTPDPTTIPYNTSLPEALEIITQSGFRYLPVVKDNEFLGMIDIRDLYKAVNILLKEAMETQSSIFSSMMREPYGHSA